MRAVYPTDRPAGQASRTIGVLSLQGDVFEHIDHLERLGVDVRPVKHPGEFEGLCGLILPGGESTCLSRLIRIFGIDRIIRRKYEAGMKIWGTCAGAILLAKAVVGEAAHLGLIEIEIERNSFGSQLESFATEAVSPRVSPAPIPMTFIRAPKITAVGNGVEVLVRIGDFIAAAESPEVLVTVFHPELTPSLAFHRYFAAKCGITGVGDAQADKSGWNSTSWTRLARIAT